MSIKPCGKAVLTWILIKKTFFMKKFITGHPVPPQGMDTVLPYYR